MKNWLALVFLGWIAACAAPRTEASSEVLLGAWRMTEVRGAQTFGQIESSVLSFAADGTLAGWMRTEVGGELRLSTTNATWRAERGRLWVDNGLGENLSTFWLEDELLVIEDDASGLRIVYERTE